MDGGEKFLSGGMRMRRFLKRAAVLPALALTVALALPVAASAQDLVPVGRTVGIEAQTDGLLVASLSKVDTANGESAPAADAGVMPGDIIVRLNSQEIKSVEDFTKALADELDGSEIELTVLRDEKTLQLTLKPVQDVDGVWRLGVWLRSSVSGIGTVTYYDPATGEYGALGHSITDADTGVLLPISEGTISEASGVRRRAGAKGGRPEKPHGSYDASKGIGRADANTPHGIFGTSRPALTGNALPVAEPDADL